MKKLTFLTLLSLSCCLAAQAADLNIGFVNFKACVEKSKQGQHERNAFEALKKQMSEALENRIRS